jgi:hypothetical protein
MNHAWFSQCLRDSLDINPQKIQECSHMLVCVYHVCETAVVWGLRELIPVIQVGIGLMQIDRLAFDYLKYIHELPTKSDVIMVNCSSHWKRTDNICLFCIKTTDRCAHITGNGFSVRT